MVLTNIRIHLERSVPYLCAELQPILLLQFFVGRMILEGPKALLGQVQLQVPDRWHHAAQVDEDAWTEPETEPQWSIQCTSEFGTRTG